MVRRVPLSPRQLEGGPHAVAPAGVMAAFAGALVDADPVALDKLAPEDRGAMSRVRAFAVPSLEGLVVEIPRTLEANREALALLARTFPFPFEWRLERPIFGALHKQMALVFACEAPSDEATGQPMCLVVRGPVTHVEGVSLDTTDGRQRLERVQRSFSATTDFRATLRSFSMRARIERAVWANVQAPFV
ncbi:MAG: hypothetical protein ACK5U8_01720 [Deltaproteobacteria bacterium]